MRKLLFIPFIIGVGISLYSCNVDEGRNLQTYTSPAIVDYKMEMGGTIICTRWGYFAAPSLTSSSEGDCLYIKEFTIDFDNQPSDKYYTAVNIDGENVDKSFIQHKDPSVLDEYTLPISAADGDISVFYHGVFFTVANCMDKNPDFRLIYNLDEPEIDGTKNLYLQARPSSSTPNLENVTKLYAFDMYNFIYNQGSDTSVLFTGYTEKIKCKYIKADLNYFTGISAEGKPEYKKVISVLNKPYDILIFDPND